MSQDTLDAAQAILRARQRVADVSREYSRGDCGCGKMNAANDDLAKASYRFNEISGGRVPDKRGDL